LDSHLKKTLCAINQATMVSDISALTLAALLWLVENLMVSRGRTTTGDI